MIREVEASPLSTELILKDRWGQGSCTFEWTGDFPSLAPALTGAANVFCRHAMPVEDRYGDPHDLALNWSVHLKGRTEALGVQVWRYSPAPLEPKEVRTEVVRVLEADGHPFRPKDPELVLSAYITKDGTLLAGASHAWENRSPFPGGAFRLAPQGGPSRSGRKLEEALHIFSVDAHGKRALDIGAAPGGWTETLLDLGCKVTSVDRAPLALTPRSGLTMVQGDFRQAFLKGPFDLVTCDANGPFRGVGEGLGPLGSQMSPGAVVLWTVKFGDEDPLRVMREAKSLLPPAFQLVDGRQLFHNRQEATLLFRYQGDQ